MKINFDKLTGKGVKVGFIDTGVTYRGFEDVLNVFKSNYKDYDDYIGHGTTVANIIRQVAPESKLYNLKVFDRKSNTNPNQVIKAIDRSIDLGLDIINLSLGTTDFFYYKKFKKVVERANKNNCILVCAVANDYSFSLPAVLDNVVSVGSSNSAIENKYGYYFIKDKYIQCITDGGHYSCNLLNDLVGRKYQTSYAAPIISSIIALIIEAKKQIDFQYLLEILKVNSINQISPPNYTKLTNKSDTLLNKYDTYSLENQLINKSKKILYCPISFDKEEHLFTEYKDLLSNEIVNLTQNKTEYDLFVIGDKILDASDEEIEMVKNIILKSLSCGKKILSLISQKYFWSIFSNSDLIKNNIHYINSYFEGFKNNTIRVSPNNNTPVVVFIDLTQDKYLFFETQLIIRRCLIKKYKFSHIAPELNATLFGIDFVLNYESIKDELLISDIGPFINYINHYYTSKSKQGMVFYSFNTSPFLHANDLNNDKMNEKSGFTFQCLNNIYPDSFIININSHSDINLIKLNILNICNMYNPDFIILLINEMILLNYIDSITNRINILINEIKNNIACDIYIYDERQLINEIENVLLQYYK